MSDQPTPQTPEVPKKREKRSSLNGKQRFALQTELLKMNEEIQAGKMSCKMVLPGLQERLGFAMTVWNVKDAAEIAGVKLHTRPVILRRVKRAEVDVILGEVKALRDEVARLRHLCGVLKGEAEDMRAGFNTLLDAVTSPAKKEDAGAKVKYRVLNGQTIRESVG
jgi:hypothetical protein